MSVAHPRMIGPAPLGAAAALIAIVLLAVFVSAKPSRGPASAPPIAERWLRFADRADGAVLVSDAGGASLAVVTGQAGFLRGTLGSLVRVRRLHGEGDGAPFHLARYADRRLVLDDPATGQAIELAAFGPTNRAVFAQFLDPSP